MSASKNSFVQFIKKFENKYQSLCFTITDLDNFLNSIHFHNISVLLIYNGDEFSHSFCSCLTQEFLNNVNFFAFDVSGSESIKSLIREIRFTDGSFKSSTLRPVDCVRARRSSLFLFTRIENRYETTFFIDDFNKFEFIMRCCNETTGISSDIFFIDLDIGMVISDLKTYGIKVVKKWGRAVKKSEVEEKLILVYFHDEKGHFSKNFWKVIKNKSIAIFKEFIFYIHDQSNPELLYKTEVEDLSVDLNQLNGCLIFQYVNKNIKLTEVISGNINEQDLIIKLYDLHKVYENKKKKILLHQETSLYNQAVSKFQANFNNTGFIFETVSLKNAFDNHVFTEPSYLRKMVIICMYTEKTPSMQNLFSTILNNEHLKNRISFMYHIVLWNVDDEKNIDVFKKVISYMNFEQSLINSIQKNLCARTTRLLLFRANLFHLPNLLPIIREVRFYEDTLKDIFTLSTNIFIIRFKITDLYEIEAMKNVTLDEDYQNFTCKQPLRKIISEVLQKNKAGQVVVLNFYNFCTEDPNLREVIKSLPKDSKVITWKCTDDPKKLIRAVDYYFNNEEIRSAIGKNKHFIFISTGEGMVLLKHKQFLKEALNILSTPLKNKRSPFVFQQMTCEKLGDRHFNKFNLEKVEHREFLKDWIGFALFGLPNEAEQKYNLKQGHIISKMINEIKIQNSKYSPHPQYILLACVYNCFIPFGKDINDFVIIPVIVLQKCSDCPGKSCRIFIDSELQVYNSWEDYLSNKYLATGINIVPQEGIYQQDCFGKVRLEFIYNLPEIISGLNKLTLAGNEALTLAEESLIPVDGVGVVEAKISLSSVLEKGVKLESICNMGEFYNPNDMQARAVIRRFKISHAIICILYDWSKNGESKYSLTPTQLVACILFYSHSIYNIKSASLIMDEFQKSTVGMDFDKPHENMRKRKLLKESSRIKKAFPLEVSYYPKRIINDPVQITDIPYRLRDNFLISCKESLVNTKILSDLSNIENLQILNDIPSMRFFKETPIINKNRENNLLFSCPLKLLLNYRQEDLGFILMNTFSPFVSHILIDFTRVFLKNGLNFYVSSKKIFSFFNSPVVVLMMILDYFQIKGLEIAEEHIEEDVEHIEENITNFIEKAIIVASLNFGRFFRSLAEFSVTWTTKKVLDYFEDNNCNYEFEARKCGTCYGFIKFEK